MILKEALEEKHRSTEETLKAFREDSSAAD